jgi:hypothetical protein
MAISSFQYNGVNLGIVLTEVWGRENIYDGNYNYLHTRHVIRVVTLLGPQVQIQGFVNQQLIASNLLSVPTESLVNGQLPVNTAQVVSNSFGTTGALTDEAIRHLLSVPRGRLTVTVGDKLALSSPRTGSTTDSNNGPKPLNVTVKEIRGTHSYLIDFTIEVALNENYLFALTTAGLGNTVLTNNPVVTSVLTAIRSEIDQDYYTTRTVHQTAKLNVDEMRRQGLRAEQIIETIAPTISPGFQRIKAVVDVSPDETTVTWDAIDRETALQILSANGGVTRIEAYQTESLKFLGNESLIVNLLFTHLETATRGLQILAIAGRDPVSAGFAAGAAAADYLANAAKVVYNHLPIRQTDIVVRVWGHKGGRRDLLQQIATLMIINRLGGINNALFRAAVSGFNAQVTHDLMGKFVEIKLTILGSPILSTLTVVQEMVFGNGTLFPSGVGSDATAGITDDTSTNPAQSNPPPPGGFVSGLNPVAQSPTVPQEVGVRYGQVANPPPARLSQQVTTP